MVSESRRVPGVGALLALEYCRVARKSARRFPGHVMKGDLRLRYMRWRREAFRFYRLRVHPRVPAAVTEPLLRAYGALVRTRLSPGVTRVLGPRYRAGRKAIELDIAWACNLKCAGCSRACDVAPTGEMMSVAQVRRFVQESIDQGVVWHRISVLGGEPTLHPDLDEILALLVEYRDRHSPRTRLRLFSNGYGERVREALARIPAGIEVRNTAKDREHEGCQDFVPFNVAPIDCHEFGGVDFRNLCQIARDCGMALTPHGYYACVGAGPIDRVFGYDLGRQSMPAPGDDLDQVLPRFCRLCGFFRLHIASFGARPGELSPTWQAGLERWRRDPS